MVHNNFVVLDEICHWLKLMYLNTYLFLRHVLSRAINFGRQGHFKILLDCHNFKKLPCLIMPTSTKCQKIEKKMTINVIQHDDRL
jgi:predicted glycosyltransferase